MGAHRSGTTWLHQLLAETGCFDYLSAYHVISYDLLGEQPRAREQAPAYQELCETFKRLGLNRRLIDEVEISPDVPEEYGFVLSNAGTGLRVTPRNLPILDELCRRLRSSPERPMVLKNPWDFANFLYLKQAIPKARFIFIHRHPERVIDSGLRAARSVYERRNPYLALLSHDYVRLFSGAPSQRLRLWLLRLLLSRRLEAGVRIAASGVAKGNLYFVRNISRLPLGDYLSLRYEDLCERPVEIFGRVLEFLGVQPSRVALPRTGSSPRRTGFLPEVEWYKDTIARKTAAYMGLHGYRPGGGVEPRPLR
jgi:hypothetical protein